MIVIPFPCGEQFSSGLELWGIDRIDTPDNLVFTIIYQNIEVVNIPIGKVTAGSYDISGTIKLSEKKYEVISITLNNDVQSGSIKLKIFE